MDALFYSARGVPPRRRPDTSIWRVLRALLIGMLGVLVATAHAETKCSDEHYEFNGLVWDTYPEAMDQCAVERDRLIGTGGLYVLLRDCYESMPGTPWREWIEGHVGVDLAPKGSGESTTFEYYWMCKLLKDGEGEDKDHDAKALGEAPDGNAVGDPIDTATGNVYRHEEDIRVGPWLHFTRSYNSSAATGSSDLGAQWSHSYGQHLRFSPATDERSATARITFDNGKVLTYRLQSNKWIADADITESLTWTHDSANQPTGWTFKRDAEGILEHYAANGTLSDITLADGVTLELKYAADRPALTEVIDPTGRSLRFAYDDQQRLARITTPDDGVTAYSYDNDGNLNTVTYPGNATRTYLYDEAAHSGGAAPAHRLTGVQDENGQRSVTYDYQADGRAIASAFAEGSQHYAVQYHDDGSSTTTDPLGAVSTRHYITVAGIKRVAQLQATCAACGTIAAWNYDEHGNVMGTDDFNGQHATFTYNAQNLLTGRTDAVGTAEQRRTAIAWSNFKPIEHTTFDAHDHMVAHTLIDYGMSPGMQPTTRCEIDPAQTGSCPTIIGLPLPDGVRRYVDQYCVVAMDVLGCPFVGLLQVQNGPLSNASTGLLRITYYMDTDVSGCGVPGGACHRRGDRYQVTRPVTITAKQITTYVAYDANGRVVRMRDPNNVLTDLSYDARGGIVSRTVRANADGSASPNDAVTRMTYDAVGNLLTVTDADGVTLTYAYDPANRLTDITDALGNRIHYTLDAMGHKTAETISSADGSLARTLTRSYNALGQLATLTDGLQHTVFDASAAGSYDGNGNLLRSADASGIRRQQHYNGLNRLIGMLDDYNGTDATTRDTAIAFALNPRDQLDGVSDPDALMTQYDHDGLGNTVALHSPDTGTTATTYDIAGRALTQTDANGQRVSYTYDGIDRRIADSYADKTLDVAYKYDEANSATGCAVSYPVGRLTRVIESAVTTVYCYDAHGRVIEKQQTQGTQTDTTRYRYSLAGRLIGMIYPTQAQITYTRNAAGQIATVQRTSVSGASQTLISNAAYLPFGPIARYTLGNGQTVTRSYDDNGQVIAIDSPAYAIQLGHDAMGRITQSTEQGQSNSYRYDALGRLTTVSDAQGTILASYTYNRTGDRLSKTGNGTAVGNYTYQPDTHRLSATGNAALELDANGNTTGSSNAGSSFGFGYDARNRLTVVQQAGSSLATYAYNAMSERITKQRGSSTQRYVYDEGSQLVGEYSDTARDYVYLDNLPIAVIDQDAGVNPDMVAYIIADQLNTPRAVADQTGKTIWQWSSINNPFGEEAPTSATGYMFNLRFPGQYFDDETGLFYNIHRYLDPATGRYRQSDPLGLTAGVSTFAYVLNSPLAANDPLGLGTFAIGGAASSQISATFSISLQLSISWNANALGDLSQWRIGGIFSATPFTVGSTGTGASAGALITYSPTNNVSSLNGWGAVLGASGGAGPVIGYDMGNPYDSCNRTHNVFIGAGLKVTGALPGEGHTGANWTAAGSFGL